MKIVNISCAVVGRLSPVRFLALTVLLMALAGAGVFSAEEEQPSLGEELATGKWDNVETLVSASLGVVVGGAVTWAVTRLHYVKAGEELRAESMRLRNLTTQVCRALEQAGVVEFARNSKEEITGIVHPGSVDIRA